MTQHSFLYIRQQHRAAITTRSYNIVVIITSLLMDGRVACVA